MVVILAGLTGVDSKAKENEDTPKSIAKLQDHHALHACRSKDLLLSVMFATLLYRNPAPAHSEGVSEGAEQR